MKKPASVVYWLEKNLYLNVTNQCHNNCFFCIRKYKEGIGGFNLKLPEEPRTEEIITRIQRIIHRKEWREVVFCGFGEPLERLDCVLQIIRWIKKHYELPVMINTNGQGLLLNTGRNVIRQFKENGLDKLSVSLNAHNKSNYEYVCRPRLANAFEGVLEFIKKAKPAIDVEITTVTIPEVDITEVKKIAENLRVSIRTRKYIPCFW